MPMQNPIHCLSNHDAYQKTLASINNCGTLYRNAKIISATEKCYSDQARELYLRLANLKEKRRQFEASEMPLLVSISTYEGDKGKHKYRVAYYIPEVDAIIFDTFDNKEDIVRRPHTLDLRTSKKCFGKTTRDIVADAKAFISKRFEKRYYKDWKTLRKSVYTHYFS